MSVDRSQVGKAVVLVSVTDVNDNAPSFAIEYKAFVCENAEPGQVNITWILFVTHFFIAAFITDLIFLVLQN